MTKSERKKAHTDYVHNKRRHHAMRRAGKVFSAGISERHRQYRIEEANRIRQSLAKLGLSTNVYEWPGAA